MIEKLVKIQLVLILVHLYAVCLDLFHENNLILGTFVANELHVYNNIIKCINLYYSELVTLFS